jgi:metal-dependent hydrolase (beta-lactamase superfamily II)
VSSERLKQHKEQESRRKELSDEQTRQKEKLLEKIRRLLEVEEFREVMGEVLSMGHIFHSVMTGNSFSFHNSGRQDYAKEILALMMEADKQKGFDLLKIDEIPTGK